MLAIHVTKVHFKVYNFLWRVKLVLDPSISELFLKNLLYKWDLLQFNWKYKYRDKYPFYCWPLTQLLCIQSTKKLIYFTRGWYLSKIFHWKHLFNNRHSMPPNDNHKCFLFAPKLAGLSWSILRQTTECKRLTTVDAL